MANATATLRDIQYRGNKLVKTYTVATGATDTGTCTIVVGEHIAGADATPIIKGLNENDTIAITRSDIGDTLVITFATAGLPSIRTLDIECGPDNTATYA